MRERGCLLSGIRPGGMGDGLLQQPTLLELVLQHLLYAAAVAVYQLLGGSPHLHPTPAPLSVTALSNSRGNRAMRFVKNSNPK